MDGNRNNYFLSVIAFLGALLLAVIYLLAPPSDHSHRLHLFLIDCIPDAFIALVAIPTVYYMFTRHGIDGLRAESLSAASDTAGHANNMPNLPGEVEKASAPSVALDRNRSVLVVVDVQNDFISGTLKAHEASKVIQPINNAIRIAESRGMMVVFTRDWHPEDHWSFKRNGGPYETHCVRNTPGAKLAATLRVPEDSLTINFGTKSGDIGYSALENNALAALISNPDIENVYVTGIALNYCVQCICLSIARLGKRTVAIEEAIASADGNVIVNEKVWKELKDQGIVRLSNVAAFAAETASGER